MFNKVERASAGADVLTGAQAAVLHGSRWLRRSGTGTLVETASSLLLTSIVTSGLGVVFWWFADRQFSPAAVGLAAGALSACQLLASFSTLGLGTLLIAELPRLPAPQRGVLVSTALTATAVTGCVLGALFALAGDATAGGLGTSGLGPGGAAVFVLAVSSTAVGLVVDQVLVGSLRGKLQLLRNAIFALAKLAGLVALAVAHGPGSGVAVFATWPAAMVAALLAIVPIAARGSNTWKVPRPRPKLLRGLSGPALCHHLLNLALQLPSLVLPVLVTVLLSPEVNAYFYTAWMVTSVATLPQTALTTTLFAVGAREPNVLAERTRLTLLLSLAAGGLAILVVGFGGSWILGLFGRGFADQATSTLRLLILAVLPLTLKHHYLALQRVLRNVWTAALAASLGAGLELVLAGFGAQVAGISGLTTGWLVGLTIEAIWMTPSVLRFAVRGAP